MNNPFKQSRVIQTAINTYDRIFGHIKIHNVKNLEQMSPRRLARHIVRLELRTVKNNKIKSPTKYSKELLIRIRFDLLIPALIAGVIFIKAYVAIPIALIAIFAARRLYINHCREIEREFADSENRDNPNARLVARCMQLQRKFISIQKARKDSDWESMSKGKTYIAQRRNALVRLDEPSPCQPILFMASDGSLRHGVVLVLPEVRRGQEVVERSRIGRFRTF